MSKIALTPNATGTGVFTISSPATNTDRTLTLPDEAGSIVVNTATGIDVTGTITADGLTVGNATDPVVKLLREDATTGVGESIGDVQFWTTDTSGGGDTKVRAKIGSTVTSIYNAADLTFYTGTSGGGLASDILKRMQISGDGDISFYEATGTTPKFFWDASAEGLALGHSTPDGALDIEKTVNTAWSSALRANDFLQISNASTTGGSYSGIELIATGVGAAGAAEIVCIDSGSGSGDLAFSTRNSSTWGERLRINSSGKFMVGRTVSVEDSLIKSNNGISIYYPNTNSYWQMYRSSDNTCRWTDGTVYPYISAAGAWTNSSDERLKENIVDSIHGLSSVLATQPRSFKFKHLEDNQVGFIAQELKNIIPEVVDGDEDGTEMLGVNYGALVAVAFKAIQEQQATIKAQQTKIDAMETRLAALEAV
jgi:hypothetical protein